jgi:hypothetical protein
MISFNNLGNLGRLGNQMFQYASLRGIATNRGFDFCIPFEKVFGINDINVKNSNTNIHTAFDLQKYSQDLSDNKMIHEDGFHFNEQLFNTCEDNIDLYGYFQSEKYFKHIESEIRKDFTFKQEVVDVCKKFIEEEINSDEVISLHIRRKDYLGLQSYHPVPPLEYYEYALNNLPDIPVLIFSDDIDWCLEQEIFSSEKFFVSMSNSAEHDMSLMSMCNYHIIANSSFSWWGAWLSNSKKVIAPKVWFGPSLCQHDTSDLYCEEWIKV